MSSSTKMYGPGISWTSHRRTRTETTTIPVSQAASGIRAARATRLLPTEVGFLQGMRSRSLACDERRHASSSVVPIATGIGTPCVLAWLAPHTRGTGQHPLKEPELGQPPGDLRRLGAPRRHADGCRGLAHLAQHGGADGPAARDAFERRGLELRDPVEVVGRPRQLLRPRA